MNTRIAIVVATLGRREVVSELVRRLARQTRAPDRVLICVARPEDAPSDIETGAAEIINAPIGSCAQRNAGLDAIGDGADLIAFLDDDFVPAPDYLEKLEAYFAAHGDIAGATGLVLRDGVTGPGLTFDDADAAIGAHAPVAIADAQRTPRNSLYGANMTFRCEAVANVRFDEKLPLYGWLEDVDFSALARRWGPLVKTDAFAGVHLGVKGGRTSGVRFGYSQIVNPIYLNRKGTMTLGHAADNIARTVIANHLRAIAPEPHVDRRGRVKGNWRALGDILTGRLDPARILSL